MIADEVIKEGLLYSFYSTTDENYFGSSLSITKNNSISITYVFSTSSCSFINAEQGTFNKLIFQFNTSFLSSFLNPSEIEAIEPKEQNSLCCNTQLLLHEITTSKVQGGYRKMFLESKAIALLLCFQQCANTMYLECNTCKFLLNPTEKEKIVKAKDIILSNLQQPLTIPVLSTMVGINQCYLKKGFKELYNTTIYDFVQEQRMQKAKLLLTTTTSTISQIATEVGFSTVGNFSIAFKKQTGVLPGAFTAN